MAIKTYLTKEPRKLTLKKSEDIFQMRALFMFAATFLFCFMQMNEMQAQILYVQQTNQLQNEIATNEITKISFQSGKMELTKTDGSINSFSIENIMFMSFIDFTTETVTTKRSELYDLKLYPNPASDMLNISFEPDESGKNQLIIFNLQGQIVMQKEMNCLTGKNSIELDLKNLSAGIYFLRIKSQYISTSTHFIKQ